MGLKETLKSGLGKLGTNFRSEELKPKLKVLIEGGFQDSWLSHHVTAGVEYLPQNAAQLLINGYSLDLIGRRNGAEVGEIPLDDRLGGICVEFNIPITIIQRPTTVLTEDGRVFHDKTLFTSPSENNRTRMSSFLESFVESYGSEDPFGSLYNLIAVKKA